jgi:hypothetical protein
MHLCPKIVFFSINELLPGLVETTKQLYDLPALIELHFTTTSFDLWVLKVGCHINFFSR